MVVMKIEQNIPIPKASARAKYPFSYLEINDSVLIEGKTAYDIGGSLTYIRKKHPKRKFISRTVEEGVRVWRTK